MGNNDAESADDATESTAAAPPPAAPPPAATPAIDEQSEESRSRSPKAIDEQSEESRSRSPKAIGAEPPRPPRTRRSRITSLLFLVFGAFVAIYLATLRPQEQHVRVVLGRGAPEVTGVSLQYLSPSGEIAREAHFSYQIGQAPRIVAHEPQLPNGAYRLQIDVDEREGRRAIQRQVTLGGGSTQIDVSDALTTHEEKPSDE